MTAADSGGLPDGTADPDRAVAAALRAAAVFGVAVFGVAVFGVVAVVGAVARGVGR